MNSYDEDDEDGMEKADDLTYTVEAFPAISAASMAEELRTKVPDLVSRFEHLVEVPRCRCSLPSPRPFLRNELMPLTVGSEAAAPVTVTFQTNINARIKDYLDKLDMCVYDAMTVAEQHLSDAAMVENLTQGLYQIPVVYGATRTEHTGVETARTAADKPHVSNKPKADVKPCANPGFINKTNADFGPNYGAARWMPDDES